MIRKGESQSMNAGSLLLVDCLIEGKDSSDLGHSVGGPYMISWKSCELVRDGRFDAVEAGTTQCGDGIEMMACGRVGLPHTWSLSSLHS